MTELDHAQRLEGESLYAPRKAAPGSLSMRLRTPQQLAHQLVSGKPPGVDYKWQQDSSGIFVRVPTAFAVITRNTMAHDFIDRVNELARLFFSPDPPNIQHTDHNANALIAWAQAEGGAAWFNMLNTTWHTIGDGSWVYNWAGVRSYPDFSTGVDALAHTILQTNPAFGYMAILSHLRNNDGAGKTLEAVENSQWGTGGLALRVLPQVVDDYWKYANLHVAPT